MTFSAIRSIAGSALSASQLSMQVSSANIANADTEGYSRKSVVQSASVTGGSGSGVAVTAISANVDKYLLADLLAAASALGSATTMASFANSLQAQLGNTSGSDDTGTSLAATITALQTALSSLSGTPESDTLKGLALSALDAVASQLRETSSSVQGLRSDADHQIEDAVGTVNSALEQIADLNKQIVAAKARGDSTADLEDQRNAALKSITGLMDVSYYVTSRGEMRISTSSGTTLLDSSVHTISYSAAATAATGTVFSAIAVDGKDITGEIKSGTIGALINQRDNVLPATQSELDTLAAQLILAVNTLSNTGTASPPPSGLTGSASVAAADALDATGTTRVAVTDSDGNLVFYQDIDLSTLSTVGDLVDALNAVPGVSASISSAGKLVISATDSTQGIALGDIDASVGTANAGLSAYFGLNDLLAGTSATDISVRKDLLPSSSLLPVSALDTSATLTAGEPALATSAGLAQDLSALFSAGQSFAWAGSIGSITTTFADYAAKLVGNAATRAAGAQTAEASKQSAYDALSASLSSASGVNLDEETARISELQQLYSTAAQLFEVLNAMFEALLSAAKS
ncbi:flagellar hook-associated protein 1 [Youhaiella tibetensis]|uniref:Flagellar hook-associated protein 1 n=1 Tax=Paradevosia tibetensis TaxID=1447062 RepID=A0A5B9DT11_9HYPH|nr:flagellar hook-associated protein FlgK [Youhaiella tibetensis]QEE22192.1 flagellar hook-associated protein FlgK [Youhaiella tibetensis]GGF44499.1 flagellar hook-associated protein 1 [Youhaiella tibetensis]